MTKTTTVTELANLLGVTQRRIEQLHSDGTIPAPDKHGKIDLGQAVRGYIGFLKSSKGQSLSEARREKVLVETELANLQLAKERGELASVTGMAERANRVNSAIRAHILASTLEKEDQYKILAACKQSWATEFSKEQEYDEQKID